MSRFLFVHIPKTGGTSVRIALEANYENSWLRNPSRIHHDTIQELKQYNRIDQNTKVFTIVRNPYSRAVSYYFHFMNHSNIQLSFEQFLLMVKEGKATSRTPFIKYDQTYFIIDSNNNIDVPFIFKNENMNQLEQFLGMSVDKLNVGSYNKDNTLSLYNNKTVDLVRQIYTRDFLNFNYSMDF